YRLQEKAAKVGFDWEKIEDVWDKVLEEIEEMHEAKIESEKSTPKKISNADYEKLEEEFGDVFFALVNYARFLHINPENALRKTNRKFIKRFSYVEQKIAELGKKINESNLAEMDNFWEESKRLKE